MESGLTDQEMLADYIAKFEDADESSQESVALAKRCSDYRHGNQFTPAERAELAKRKQPVITINRVRRKVDWLRGLEMQSRTDPKAFPRTPKHQEGAQAATDAIRYVCDNTDFDRKRSAAWDNMLVEGIGALEVVHNHKPPMREPEIAINWYSYDRIFYDPYSRAPDFSDARYVGVVIWQDVESLKHEFPGEEAAAMIDASVASAGMMTGNFDDQPSWKVWADKSRKRVRLVLIHCLRGDVWHWAKFVHGGILDGGESPYQDEHGASVCPLIMQSAYVDREGGRHGVVKDMLDPQDEINKRRSKLLHQLNSRQTMGLKGALSVVDLKSEMAKPDGHIEIDPAVAEAAGELGMRPFEIIQNADQTAGQFSLLQEAKTEIDMMGANSGLAGKDGQSGQSGRAIIAKQQGGLIEIAPLTDGLSDLTRRVYRHIWMRVRQFWKEEKWVRVTDDEKNARFVGLNRQITLGEQLGQMPEEQAQSIMMEMGLMPDDPRLAMPIGVENSVEEIDVDILLEEVPDAVTLEAETFEQIVNISTSMPGSVPPEVLIELAPGLKREVKEKILAHLKAQSEQQAQAGQQQTAMQGQMMEIEAGKKQAETQKTLSLASKTDVETQRLALGY